MEKETFIHPTAIVEAGAKIGRGVEIEAYAVVKGSVTLEDAVTIKSFAYIDGHTTIGEGSIVWPSASIGTKTQDRKYRGERTYVKIGKRCEIREFVTINSSCEAETTVEVGDDCLIMAYCHIAHHCRVGKGVIMTNSASLAGHVEVGDYAIIGGFTPVHQFVRIGRHAMVGGMARVAQDVAPYTIGGDIPFRLAGINLVGLKRHKFPFEVRKELGKAFKLIFRSTLSLEEALQKIESELHPFEEVTHFAQFCRQSKRGLIGMPKKVESAEASQDQEEERESAEASR